MQAAASSTNDTMPMMCDVNRCVNGNMKPVALVTMVKARKIAVEAGIRLERSSPDMTTKPDAIATRLMITCKTVKSDRLRPNILWRAPQSKLAVRICHGRHYGTEENTCAHTRFPYACNKLRKLASRTRAARHQTATPVSQ